MQSLIPDAQRALQVDIGETSEEDSQGVRNLFSDLLSKRVSHLILRTEKPTHHLQTLAILLQEPAVTLTGNQKAVLECLHRHFLSAQETDSPETQDPILRSLVQTKRRREEDTPTETCEKPKAQAIRCHSSINASLTSTTLQLPRRTAANADDQRTPKPDL